MKNLDNSLHNAKLGKKKERTAKLFTLIQAVRKDMEEYKDRFKITIVNLEYLTDQIKEYRGFLKNNRPPMTSLLKTTYVLYTAYQAGRVYKFEASHTGNVLYCIRERFVQGFYHANVIGAWKRK